MQNRSTYHSDGEELLSLASACRQAGAAFRASRRRCKDYAYGRQWSDRILVDGVHVTEEEYIRSQGNIPLKNNLIRRLVRNVIGVFRSSLEKKMEGWDEDARRRARLNRMETLLPRTFEEFLISGMAVHRKWVGERCGVSGVWTDMVSPDSFFYDPAARDSRGSDMSLLGQVHDLTLDRLLASFARDEAERQRLDSIMAGERRIRVVEIWRRTSEFQGGKSGGKGRDVWRYAYVLPGGLVLREGISPYPHASHPFVFTAYPFLDGEIHSFVDDLIDQQRYTNRLITLYDWVIRASAKGVLLFPEDAIPPGGDIQEIADQWGRFNGVIVYRPKVGQPLPQQVAGNTVNIGIGELLDIQMRMMEDVSGVSGALQGRMENRTMSGTLYNQQTENSLTSLRDILGTFESFIDDSLHLDRILATM